MDLVNTFVFTAVTNFSPILYNYLDLQTRIQFLPRCPNPKPLQLGKILLFVSSSEFLRIIVALTLWPFVIRNQVKLRNQVKSSDVKI